MTEPSDDVKSLAERVTLLEKLLATAAEIEEFRPVLFKIRNKLEGRSQ